MEYVMNEPKDSPWFLAFVTSPRSFLQLTAGSLVTRLGHALDHPTLALTGARAAVSVHLCPGREVTPFKLAAALVQMYAAILGRGTHRSQTQRRVTTAFSFPV